METALRSGVERARIITALKELNLIAAFLAEAFIDLVNLLARLIEHSLMAKKRGKII